ncbi:MAG: proline--tRNA ligase [Legionellaceae bacterium]|nr:proline--tRNA ligase [Legionellaceae bacterium]
MRASQWMFNTLKESPHDAEIISHQLMLRAGMIRKLGSGLYTWLPLGLKILRKVEAVVRDEMNSSQALEILMPAIQPAELWKETGRWETFGNQLLTMQDNSGREYCYGPTHEEVVTDLMRSELRSYRQLPLNIYQIQTKFRDEIRPRFGVMRAREFIMKDAYSFHLSPDCLEQTYQKMYETYCRIFDRLGLRYRAVEADTGAIGGARSHEFQVLAESGEDLIFYSDTSNYAANVEQACSLRPNPISPSHHTAEKVLTPACKTIDAVSAFLKVSPAETVKTLIVAGSEEASMVALVLRGDHSLNPIKAAKHPLVAQPLRLIDEATLESTLGIPIGSIGPLHLSIPILVDHHVMAMPHFVCGANIPDAHYRFATFANDNAYTEICDLRTVETGDPSPDGKGILQACRGIEVGHVFQLGNKYSQSMNLQVLDETGVLQTPHMGCYGLGVSRVVAAAIEQHHDERGICWPQSLAPFTLSLIPIYKTEKTEILALCERLYQYCLSAGIDVLLEDRDERPGVLFADHDLIGIPHRFVVSEKHFKNNQLEYKSRTADAAVLVDLDSVERFISDLALPKI